MNRVTAEAKLPDTWRGIVAKASPAVVVAAGLLLFGTPSNQVRGAQLGLTAVFAGVVVEVVAVVGLLLTSHFLGRLAGQPLSELPAWGTNYMLSAALLVAVVLVLGWASQRRSEDKVRACVEHAIAGAHLYSQASHPGYTSNVMVGRIANGCVTHPNEDVEYSPG